MDQEVVDKLKSFCLSAEEKVEISLEEKDVLLSKEGCGRSLLGKIFGHKKSNFAGLRNTLLSIWQTKEVFSVREIGHNLFQFVFASQEDKSKVLGGKSWSFDNQYLLLREWYDNILEHVDSFTSIGLWLQVWNLPYHWITMETGRKIGLKFESVLDVLIPETGSSNGRFLKVLVEVDLTKPLLRGTFIKLGGVSCWIDFKYENLQGFCSYCGVIGHPDRICQKKKDDTKGNTLTEGQFGEWLRATDPIFSRVPHKITSNLSGKNNTIAPFDNASKAVVKITDASSSKDTQQLVDPQPVTVTSIESSLQCHDQYTKPNNLPQYTSETIGEVRAPPSHQLPISNPCGPVSHTSLSFMVCDNNKENSDPTENIESTELVDISIKATGNRAPLKEIQNNSPGLPNPKANNNKGGRRSLRRGTIGHTEFMPMDFANSNAEISCEKNS
ncbi:LOW QUALITY PROTEIN: hypothetical protein DH2020_036067 [Rehmannia glutinosa]|uniref:DUF4283 domain-containing protein n=1 Tax=Rehmannia glutinosa TaxID=99300 RepID=A0ABR0V7R8_REHGL